MSQGNEILKDQAEELKRNLDSLTQKIDEVRQLRGSSAGNSSVNINMGGWGVAVAVGACLIMLVVNGAVRDNQMDQSRRIDRMQDHLTAIYMMAPHLKPKEQPDVIDNHHNHPAADQAEAP